MSEPHRNILSVERLGRDVLKLDDPDQLERALHEINADAVLLEWNDRNPVEGSRASGAPRGLFAVLGAAARQQRVVFPARWLPVRPDGSTHGPAARLLAFARSDAALQHLFADSADGLDGSAGGVRLSGRGLSRPDEPLLLLGIEGDALMEAAGSGSSEFRRRAEQWIQRLGADRIVLAVPSDAGPQHPLVELARQRALPIFRVGAVGWARASREGEVSADFPLLWTDFQLDTEHRLPDDSCIPGLRDLIHRGALLRERTLYDRLPPDWRNRVDAELRALYAWHVSPLLRRVSAGLQLLDAVDGVQIGAPMPQLRSVTAWLLGLTDQRPHAEVLAAEDPVKSARRLAQALQDFDRVLKVRISAADWPRLHSRMASWAEGGFLARISDPDHPAEGLHYCFSGLPLTHRTPLRRGMDGIDLVELESADLDELGWLRIECDIKETPQLSSPAPTSPTSPGIPVFFDHLASDRVSQLALEFGAEPFRQERSA